MRNSAFPGLAVPGNTIPGLSVAKFTPPHVLRRLTVDRLEYRPFHRVNGKVALSVLRFGDGSIQTIENPTDEQVAVATHAYLGGRTYEVSDAEADALIAAGYEVTLT